MRKWEELVLIFIALSTSLYTTFILLVVQNAVFVFVNACIHWNKETPNKNYVFLDNFIVKRFKSKM